MGSDAPWSRSRARGDGDGDAWSSCSEFGRVGGGFPGAREIDLILYEVPSVGTNTPSSTDMHIIPRPITLVMTDDLRGLLGSELYMVAEACR